MNFIINYQELGIQFERDMVVRISIVIFTWILFLSTVQCMEDGYNVTETQFPWHASIKVFHQNGAITKCSGAVLNAKFIITSYKCVSEGRKFEVTLGCPYNKHWACKLYTCAYFFAPPDAYTNSIDVRDYIAILRVDVRIEFNDYIQNVTLSRPKTDSNNRPRFVKANSYANATGYLRLPDEKWHLTWLPMKVINNSECADHFPPQSLVNTLCVRSEVANGNKRGNLCSEVDVPLVRNNMLLGILKETNANCYNDGLSLFIDVQHFVDWMDKFQTSIRKGRVMHNAIQNEFPYHAHIEVIYGDGYHRNNCSGAVITPELIISSRHCVQGGTSYKVKVGSLNPDSAEEPLYYHETKFWAITPRDNKTYEGVALIRLEVPIDTVIMIYALKLPKPNANFFSGDSYKAIATGYYNRRLEWMLVQVFQGRGSCQRVYGGNLLSKTLCVGHLVGQDSCRDEGGPLVLNDRKTLVGIAIAWNTTCNNDGVVSQYVDVRQYVGWINTAIEAANTERVDIIIRGSAD